MCATSPAELLNTCVAPAVSVLVRNDEFRNHSLKLAEKLRLDRIRDVRDYGGDYVLSYSDQGLDLISVKEKNRLPLKICLDINRLKISKRDPLLRAVGKAETVIDATAGLGQDSVRLVTMGYTVTAIERNPIVYALLADALQRLTPQTMKLKFIHANSIDFLKQMSADVIVLDPMYPAGRKKGVRVKKELEILRDLCGDDDDVMALFAAARKSARKRVVVKRPLFAESLAAPSHSIETKLVRYDVYVNT